MILSTVVNKRKFSAVTVSNTTPRHLLTLMDATFSNSNNSLSPVGDITTSNIVRIIRLVDEVLWVQYDSKFIVIVHEVCDIYPLTVQVLFVRVCTIHLESLILTFPRLTGATVVLLFHAFFTLVIFQTETCFVTFSNFVTMHICEVVICKPLH